MRFKLDIARPHPSPLPQGEGESIARLAKSLRLGCSLLRPKRRARKETKAGEPWQYWRAPNGSPSPGGEGWGEGGHQSNQNPNLQKISTKQNQASRRLAVHYLRPCDPVMRTGKVGGSLMLGYARECSHILCGRPVEPGISSAGRGIQCFVAANADQRHGWSAFVGINRDKSAFPAGQGGTKRGIGVSGCRRRKSAISTLGTAFRRLPPIGEMARIVRHGDFQPPFTALYRHFPPFWRAS
jgi:hypothetical protein